LRNEFVEELILVKKELRNGEVTANIRSGNLTVIAI
jgi:hypothetical protein